LLEALCARCNEDKMLQGLPQVVRIQTVAHFAIA